MERNYRTWTRKGTAAAAVLISMTLLVAASCIDDPPTHPEMNDYREYLDMVWELYDQKYVAFDMKDVDWDDIHQQYSDLAAEADSLDQLAEVIVAMVGELEDRNAYLIFGSSLMRTHWDDVEVNWDITFLYYLMETYSFQWDQPIAYKWGSCMIDRVPYFAIWNFHFFFTYQHFRDELLEHLEAPGMVVDLRMSAGTSLVPAEQLPGLFTREYMDAFYTQYRTGPDHGDLSPLQLHDIVPKPWAYQGPVAVLVGQQTIGPGEAFASVMCRMPHVSVIGDTTGGGGNIPGYMEERYWPLWNTAEITCPFARVLKADGSSIEGAGVVPDVYVEVTAEDILAGRDPVLEYALEWIMEESVQP